MKKFFINAQIINADGRANGGVEVVDGLFGKIYTQEELSKVAKTEFDEVFDCKGWLLTPGLIDLHTHFRDPGLEYKDDIETGSKCAVAGGVTTCACMANTNPVNDNAEVTRYIVEKARKIGLIDLLPIGAITKGLEGKGVVEMGDMHEAGCVAFSDDGRMVASSDVMRYALEYSRFHGTFVISHSQDCSLCAGGHMHEGKESMRLGVRGMPREQEEIAVARDMLLAKLTGGYIHIAHISSAWSLKMVAEAKKEGVNITCEVTPHHFSFTDKDVGEYDTNFKMSPPLRERSDVEAMKQGLKDGTIDIIATDHAPHHLDEKFREFDKAPFGILGLQTLVPLSLNLVREGVLRLEDFVRLTSLNPAKMIGESQKGAVKEGFLADFALIDPEEEWVFDETTNLSKSQNSPCWKKRLTGRVKATFKAGRKVF